MDPFCFLCLYLFPFFPEDCFWSKISCAVICTTATELDQISFIFVKG